MDQTDARGRVGCGLTQYVPKLFEAGNTDFQFTRGLLGVSM